VAVAPESRATRTDMAAVLQATPQRYPLPAVRGEVRSVWSAQALRGAGAVWSAREGALYWVDTAGRQLHRFDPVRKLRDSWSFHEDVSAVTECDQQPGLLIALRRELAIFDPETGRLQRLHQAEPAHPGNRLGDGRCDAQGRFWISTHNANTLQPTGALYRYTGGSQCARLLSGLGASHGPAWSRDQRTLFLADTAQRRVLACDFDVDSGAVGPARTWLQLAYHEGSPQGLCTDAAGRIWLARAGAGSVSCHAPDTGEELLRIPVPANQVTGCTFGGPGLRTLFITSACQPTPDAALFTEPLAGALFAVEVDSPGLPAHIFAG
jgi:D-xylonolactonase